MSTSSRRQQILDGIDISPRKRRAYIDRWLSSGTLKADPDVPVGIVQRVRWWTERSIRFLLALGTHLLDGMRAAPIEQQSKRMATCKGCAAYNDKAAGCGVCGCNLRLKTKWRTSRCPEGKW